MGLIATLLLGHCSPRLSALSGPPRIRSTDPFEGISANPCWGQTRYEMAQTHHRSPCCSWPSRSSLIGFVVLPIRMTRWPSSCHPTAPTPPPGTLLFDPSPACCDAKNWRLFPGQGGVVSSPGGTSIIKKWPFWALVATICIMRRRGVVSSPGGTWVATGRREARHSGGCGRDRTWLSTWSCTSKITAFVAARWPLWGAGGRFGGRGDRQPR